MCGVSGIELIVIIFAAVIILGPDRLPEFARTAGKFARDLRKATDGLSSARDKLVNDIDPRRALSLEESDNPPERRQRRTRPQRATDNEADIDAIRARQESARAAAAAAMASQAAAQDVAVDSDADDVADAATTTDGEHSVGEKEGGGADDTAPPESGSDAEAAESEPAPVPRVAPRDPRQSPEGEVEWLKQALATAVAARGAAPAQHGDDEAVEEDLPQIRPATGAVESGRRRTVAASPAAPDPDAPGVEPDVDEDEVNT